MSNIDNKSNSCVTSDPLIRLASLKAPRDLSLGGAKPNKKIFTPNLNVARNKNKGPSTSSARDPKTNDKNKRNHQKYNKNSKNGPSIIKSSGVFSEGLGSVERRSSGISYGRESNNTHVLQKPTIRVKDVVKIDKELEDQKIKAAYGEYGAENDECEDFKHVLDVEAPVTLPMDDGGWALSQKTAMKIKKEVVVKQEPADDETTPTLDVKPPLDVKEVFEDTNVVNLLRSDKPSLILLQLADTLPGRGGNDEDSRRNNDQPTGSDGIPKQPVDNRCRMNDLEEGRVGKLRVHRSGKVTLALGDTIFEVSSGTKASFYQEVVSIAVDDSSRSASVISLGPLQHKLNVTPHWETMFNNITV